MSGFQKKWLAVSVLLHLVLAVIMYLTVIEKEPDAVLYNLDIKYIDPPEEIIEEEVPAPETPELPEQLPEQSEAQPAANEPVVLPPAIDLPVTAKPASPEESMLYSPVPLDSLTIIYELIDSLINSRFAVPLNFAFHDALEKSMKNRKPTKQDTIRIIQEQLDKLVSMALTESVKPDMLRQNDEKYTSKLNPGVLPVGVIIGMGAKLINSLLQKAFKGYNKRSIDKFLDFDEITVMLALWKIGKGTAVEIDKKLPPKSKLRLNDITQILDQLKEKMVIRLISKVDESSGGGSFKFDFSRNKTNPQYRMIYTPLISRVELVNFYDAVLADSIYSVSNAGGFSNNLGSRNLKEKIKMLTRDPFEYLK